MAITTPKYDSRQDTLAHITRVRALMGLGRDNIQRRSAVHDKSKLESPEKEMFDEFTQKLRGLTYGSAEYMAFVKNDPAIKHHWANNDHHPEFYANGVEGMSIMAFFEMLMDWKAAGERHANGDITKSVEFNTKRFNLSPQLVALAINTYKELGLWSQTKEVEAVKKLAEVIPTPKTYTELEITRLFPADGVSNPDVIPLGGNYILQSEVKAFSDTKTEKLTEIQAAAPAPELPVEPAPVQPPVETPAAPADSEVK